MEGPKPKEGNGPEGVTVSVLAVHDGRKTKGLTDESAI